MKRRDFLKSAMAAVSMLPFAEDILNAEIATLNNLFWVKNIPDEPFYAGNSYYHAGLDCLLYLMGRYGLKFYQTTQHGLLNGTNGLISRNDVVLIKVNAQWKYRGCTNSDLVRGLIQRILDHPDGFDGEIVIFENGQGWGSLNCDSTLESPDNTVHANANDESHSFLYLVNEVFNSPFVSAYLLDPVRKIFIGHNDHITDGYRMLEDINYPCFFSQSGNRIELKEGIWDSKKYTQNLKLINIPVLKHHDVGGSEITAALKHVYGIITMGDGRYGYRHYKGLGETCGKMFVSVRTPVLNIIDATWVSFSALSGYPPSATFRANQLLASQDPVALDYWAAKYILYSIDKNPRHHPDFPGIDQWLTDAMNLINDRGGIYKPEQGIVVNTVTKNEAEMRVYWANALNFLKTLSRLEDFEERKNRRRRVN